MAPKGRIEITFLASLQTVAGRGTLWLELAPGDTVARVLALLRERQPQFAGVTVVANVNGRPAALDQQLAAGDALFLLPGP